MERYFLIGYMGAGKTTLGKILAKSKGLEFIDLDHFIENRYQKSISDIFKEKGEEGFRKIESDLLKEIATFENVVISTGGGAPCFYDNIEYMNRVGHTIYLKASPDSLMRRIILSNKDKRPLLKDKSDTELLNFITETLNKREKFYNQAHIIFDVESFCSVEETERFINDLIKQINLTKN